MIKTKKMWVLLTLVISISLLLAACSSSGSSSGGASGSSGTTDTVSAEGEDAAAFYEGKRIKLIVPYDPGGGYDEYARLLIPYLEKYTGARMEIANLPGAGGMRGINELWRAPKDGLTIAHMNGSAMVTNELAGMEGAEYKVEEFEYLGRVVDDIRVLSVQPEGELQTAEDIFNLGRTIKLGATGLGGSTYVDATVVAEVLGLDQEVLHGFDSSSVVETAILRGDVDGMWGSYGSAIDRIKDGIVKVVLQSGFERSEDLPDIPTVLEMAEQINASDTALELLNVHELLIAVGRPIAAPPGIPEERLVFLRKAFEQAMNDPEFVEKAASSERELNYATGEEMDEIIESSKEMSDEVREILLAAIRGEL